ncbi:alpha/beta hydrolase [Halogeometricum limi]|uniref:Phospholipase/carboxylesterase n=1 Tax=Halogeometricum limi TaxID=555875 RepID=A0A1I6ID99_9EURY|nr:phospholipase [Halogeometricum limi]SFR64681.1 phospholipase/carboxylesterase [Halogeometricum limi]
MVAGDSPTATASGPHAGRPVVTSGAPRGATAAVVVCLHGRGATAQGVVNLFDPVYRHGVTFVAPQADRSRWYPYAATEPVGRNEPHRSSAVEVLDSLVRHVVSTFGVGRSHVVLAGFSQGASVVAEYAAHTGSASPVVVLSGTLLGPTIDTERYSGRLDGTPVFVGGGADDERVPPARLRATADVLRSLGGDVTERVSDGAGHEVTDDEFEYVRSLLASLVGG